MSSFAEWWSRAVQQFHDSVVYMYNTKRHVVLYISSTRYDQLQLIDQLSRSLNLPVQQQPADKSIFICQVNDTTYTDHDLYEIAKPYIRNNIVCLIPDEETPIPDFHMVFAPPERMTIELL